MTQSGLVKRKFPKPSGIVLALVALVVLSKKVLDESLMLVPGSVLLFSPTSVKMFARTDMVIFVIFMVVFVGIVALFFPS